MRKPILSLTLALTLPAFGQITADLAISEGGTPLGTLTLELDHLNAPMATANFIGLATGELPWIDSTTGVVRTNTAYYDGIKIHRTVKGFVSQFGSQKGDGSDGPGYTFPDQPDISSSLSHDGPYVLSMANSGPNTNGSQVFITAAATTFLDPKHIIFGSVATGAGQNLADYINCVPVVDADGADNILGNSDDNNTPVTDLVITSATINMNGVDFDIHAQGLPMVSQTAFNSIPSPGDSEASLTQLPGTSTQISYSNDLVTWFIDSGQYLDLNSSTLSAYPLPNGSTDQDKTFFRRSTTTYSSSALWPSSMASRTLNALTAADPANTFTFTFDETGVTGTWSYSNPDNPLSGDILDSFHAPDGYGCRLIMILSGINFNRWDFRRIGFDSSTPTLLNCRQSGSATITTNPFATPLSIEGTSSLTR